MNSTAKPSILLVDDEPEILFSLQGLLRREFELHTAESGAEALEILGKHAIHVIMTDQRMPEMTGAELMRRAKSQFPDAIRIVFTGYADIKAVVQAINGGALYRYITKPWDPEELVQVLRDAAAKYHETMEQRRLLADLRRHVLQGQELAGALRQASPGDDASAAEAFERASVQLLARLQGSSVQGTNAADDGE